MPTYEYNCIHCDVSVEITKPIAEADLVEPCNHCETPMTKVYGIFGIQFKGSGFYKTDNAK